MNTTPTLTQQLADYKAGFIQRVAPERVTMMEGATGDLWATGIETRALQVGNDVPVLNGNGRSVLPLPATCVIGRDGRIVFAHVESDYRERAEPADVLAAVARQTGAHFV